MTKKACRNEGSGNVAKHCAAWLDPNQLTIKTALIGSVQPYPKPHPPAKLK
jgi:hypothetical protein